MHSYSLDTGKWHGLRLSGSKRGRSGGGKATRPAEERPAEELLAGGRRRNRNRRGESSDEEVCTASKAKTEAVEESPCKAEGKEEERREVEEAAEEAPSGPVPCPRMNASSALRCVQGGVFVRCGMLEGGVMRAASHGCEGD